MLCFINGINYLCHVILPGGLEVSTPTIDTIRRHEYLTTMTELRSLLGLVNVFRHFVQNFHLFAGPLNRKLRKGQPQTFDGLSNNEITSSDTLKAKLMNPLDWLFHVTWRLYRRHKCMQQSYWLCPGTEDTRSN